MTWWRKGRNSAKDGPGQLMRTHESLRPLTGEEQFEEIVKVLNLHEFSDADSAAGISGGQGREARHLLKWTRAELAQAAGVTQFAVDAFEDDREVLPSYAVAIRQALEDAGIGFPFLLVNGKKRPEAVTYSPRDRSEGH